MIVFVDADDTLWECAALYDKAKSEYAHLLREVGIEEPDLLEQLDELDLARVPQHGLTPERFIGSMVLLYEQLATKYGSPVYLDTVRKIESLSSIILSPPILYDDTIPFLDRMSQLGHLCLVTAGDYNVQSAKVRASGLAHYFKGIYILPTKTTETVKLILESLGVEPSNCWFIGNSPRSDALPAIKLGMKAILVQRQTWAYDDIPQEERELLSSLHKASTLLEAYSIVLSNTKESY